MILFWASLLMVLAGLVIFCACWAYDSRLPVSRGPEHYLGLFFPSILMGLMLFVMGIISEAL